MQIIISCSDHQYNPTVFADPVGLVCPPLGTPVFFGGKCPLAAPVPLGNGFTEPDPLGVGKGAAPECVEKGPFGDGGGTPDPDPGAPVGWLPGPPAPPAPAVTVTMTVEVTV